jgi:hypothetical protein
VRTPHDVDVVLVMAADFKLEESPRECRTLFSHPDAEARFGASVSGPLFFHWPVVCSSGAGRLVSGPCLSARLLGSAPSAG